MSKGLEELELLWKNEVPSQLDPALEETVVRQTRRWCLLLVVEVVAIFIGILVPLFAVVRNPEPYLGLWAVDLWGVVGIAGWFTYTRAKSLMSDLDQTTDAYEQLLRMRYAHQIRAARIGIVLASLQFIILPFLYWMQVGSSSSGGGAPAIPFLIVLLVMSLYVLKMRNVAKTARLKLTDLAKGFPE